VWPIERKMVESWVYVIVVGFEVVNLGRGECLCFVLNWSFGGFKIKAFGVDFCIKMLSVRENISLPKPIQIIWAYPVHPTRPPESDHPTREADLGTS